MMKETFMVLILLMAFLVLISCSSDEAVELKTNHELDEKPQDLSTNKPKVASLEFENCDLHLEKVTKDMLSSEKLKLYDLYHECEMKNLGLEQ